VQDPAVGEDDERQLRVGGARLLDDLAAALRIGQVERVRHRAPPECLPELVRAARPRLADHEDGVRRGSLRLGPVEQQSRDPVMEELVGGRRRPEQVVVDATGRDRVEDRLADDRVSPIPPANQQDASCIRMQPARLVQEIAARRARERLGRQHQGDLLVGVRQFLHPGAGVIG
jgi:hypothetical protein